MCTTIHILSRVKLHLADSQSFNLASSNEDDLVEWCTTIAFVAHLFAYVAVLALLVISIYMIIKYLGDLDDQRIEGEVGETETNPLWPTKTVPITYGTCGEDLESGNSSSEGSSNNNNSNSSEDLYDGKVCVICYDEQRNCFFVPCGHCATCYVCAQRIFNEDNKTCPVCRRFIGKVRKLFAPKD